MSIFRGCNLTCWLIFRRAGGAGGATLLGLALCHLARAQDPSAATAAPQPGWLEIIFFSGGPLGIGIMWLLLLLSITAAYLVFDHLLNLRRRQLIPAELGGRVHQLLHAGRLGEAQEIARQSATLLGFLLTHALSEIGAGLAAV
jgi:biopolymer transport protein ExbB